MTALNGIGGAGGEEVSGCMDVWMDKWMESFLRRFRRGEMLVNLLTTSACSSSCFCAPGSFWTLILGHQLLYDMLHGFQSQDKRQRLVRP